jgi:endonuclease/exonuclease/phosphatase family metal-dependent hydrolase
MIRPGALRHLLCLLVFLLPTLSAAQTLRVATFNTELSRKGPGLLLRDITRNNDPQVRAVIEVIRQVRPDILLLQGIDWDHEGRAVAALAAQIAGPDYALPHTLSPRPNSGMATGVDLNGDGKRHGPEDAQGFGSFTGQFGMALLSRFPIKAAELRDFSTLLWRDLPDADLPRFPDGRPFPSEEAQQIQRLTSVGHWTVPVVLPAGQKLTLMAFHATPPVFDGPEDRNGRRNQDQIRFWQHLMDGKLGPAPAAPFVLLGDANLDPQGSDGRMEAIRSLLADPRLQDPMPTRPAPNDTDPATVDWPKVGQLRVDYVLPSAELEVLNSGVFWPAADAPDHAMVSEASRHRLVWVDIRIQ